MNLERKIIQRLSRLDESTQVNNDKDSEPAKKSAGVVLECTVCNEYFIEATRITTAMECPHCCEQMIPNYVGDVIPDGTDKVDDNDLIGRDSVNGQVIVYSSEGMKVMTEEELEEEEGFDLHEYRMVRAVRGGKVVKVKVRTRKKRLTAAQKRALMKARKKAHTAAAKRHRAKSVKIRKRAIGESIDSKDLVDAILQDLTNQFGLEIVSKGDVEDEDGVYSTTIRVKDDDDSTQVDVGEVEDTLTANNAADVEIIGPVYTDDARTEAELTLLITPYQSV